MYNVLKTADRRAKRIKSGNHGPMNCIYRTLFMSDSWGHSVRLAKFLMLRSSKAYSSHSFPPISTKLYGMYGYQGCMGTIAFLAICQKIKFCGTLKISYLRYIAITNKAMLVSAGKKVIRSRGSRPLGLLVWCYFRFWRVWNNVKWFRFIHASEDSKNILN